MIRIKGLQIRGVPECEGGGYFLIGDVAERIVSVLHAYENKRLLENVDFIQQVTEKTK